MPSSLGGPDSEGDGDQRVPVRKTWDERVWGSGESTAVVVGVVVSTVGVQRHRRRCRS
jgi:hypothetical protein